ncbi:PIKK family atypical protein kinase [Tritrichomonas foetus]|uniref:non-specific serine/threonine protein kinase n=1 Tax=Tritrichomonas foetus TaxID=1144522 RepID=A0A1J4KBE6_9EUKA|nr:PIKK family atypical protein kinase [Tritrichomonas foetus]|eukprot:OHT08547.1 PIKK family atypical protein kinase [Tritrichomonas foetus]
MSKRLKRQSSEYEKNSQPEIPVFNSTNPLEIRINSVYRSSNDINSFKFQLACQSFQSYVENTYQAKLAAKTDANAFFEEIFYKISLRELTRKYKYTTNQQYFLFLTLLLDLNIGSQATKANRILLAVPSIKMTDTTRTFKYFEKILVWLDNPLKTSFRLKIQPLRDYIMNWFKNHTAASLHLMIIFMRNFPNLIAGEIRNYALLIFKAISQSSEKVRHIAVKAYLVAMDLYYNPKYKHLAIPIIEVLANQLRNRDAKFDAYTIDAISFLITKNPNIIQFLRFREVPFLNTKDISNTMKIIPLAYRCSPSLFTDAKKMMIMELYQNSILHIKKKDTERIHEAFRSLTEFVFALGKNFHNGQFTDIQRVLLKKINKTPVDEYQIVALLSISYPSNQIQSAIFGPQFQLTNYLINGIISFCKKWPNESKLIQEKLVSRLLNEINNTANENIIENTFLWLMKADFYYFSQQLLVHFSRFFYHPCYKVRKNAATFLLMHQNDYPVISSLILSFVATEQITSLRNYILDQLTSVTEDNTTILYQMLHDRESIISSKALSLLCQIPNDISLIAKYVIELMHQLGRNDALNRRVLNDLLIIKNYYPQILQPFASHLCETVLNFETQSHQSLLLLSFLISTNPTISVDVSLFGRVLRAALCSDSNTRRISAALDLLYVALKYLDMRSELSYLFVRLLALSGEVEEAEVTSKLLLVLSKIGVFKPSSVKSLVASSNLSKSPNRRAHFTEKLENSSLSIPISITLETFNDPSMVTERSTAFNCLLSILKIDNTTITDSFRKSILERLENMITGETSLIMMQSFNSFINCFGEEVEPLIPHVVKQIISQWDVFDFTAIMSTVKYITLNVLDLFSPYILQFTELFLAKLPSLTIKDSIALFDILTRFSFYLKTVDYLIIPAMLNWLETHIEESNEKGSDETILYGINDGLIHLKTIIIYSGSEKFTALILKTMFILIQSTDKLNESIYDIFFCITVQMQCNIIPFLPQILSFTDLASNEKYIEYKMVLECIRLNNNIPPKLVERYEIPKLEQKNMTKRKNTTFFLSKNRLDEVEQPQKGWEAVDWIFWYEELVPQFISNSRSLAIDSLLPLSEQNSMVRTALFPISFATYFGIAEEVTPIFLKVFTEKYNAPSSVIRHFLPIAELLEMTGDFHTYAPMTSTLVPEYSFEDIAKRAMDVGEFAQALRYYEILFTQVDSDSEDPKFTKYATTLVVLNKNLNLQLAVNGILDRCNEYSVNLFKGSLAEDLGQYEEALKSYTKKLKKKPDDIENTLGKMRCLEAMAHFKDLEAMFTNENIENIKDEYLPFAASASWRLGNLDDFKKYASKLKNGNLYYKAILSLLENNYGKVLSLIQDMRKEKETEIFPLISTDYVRSFDSLCFTTILNYIEEICEINNLKAASDSLPFQRSDEISVLCQQVHNNWLRRFKEMKDSPILMYDTMRILSLYLNKEELEIFRVQFLLKNVNKGNNELMEMVMKEISDDIPEVKFVKAKMQRFNTKGKEQEQAYTLLNELLMSQQTSLLLKSKILKTASDWLIEDKKYVEARPYLKSLVTIIPADPNVWLNWSSVNLILSKENQNEQEKSSYLNISFNAILEGLKLNPEQPLRFTIKAVSILLKQGTTEIYTMLGEFIQLIPSSVWIALLPQFIARIGAENQALRNVIINILINIGESYPHAVLYSLLAPYKSPIVAKHHVASQIIERLRVKHSKLVTQVLLFSEGMMRIASTYWEQWLSAIGNARVAFRNNDDASKFIELLTPLYKMISEPPKTLFEISFMSQYGKLLHDIKPYLDSFNKNGDKVHMNYCFGKYYGIMHQLKQIVNSLSSIRIEDASPGLSQMKDSILAVPGTDYTSQSIVHIESICEKFTVFNSKQHPRKMWISGSDGVKYYFLLKANEDTRLDERVMQLFDFISQAMQHSNAPMNSKLFISTYKVIPLSGKVGLIGWLKDCQTVFDYFKQYRNRFNIPLGTETQCILSVLGNNYNAATKEDILNAFKEAIKSPNKFGFVTGNELQKALIMSSSDSNDWLERRVNFSTSLAITSIAGYTIGLGDRHLKNIMMNNKNSRLAHIDFGDSFEVAMNRKDYPEKVPFRLTRLFVNALEVTGVDGTLSKCCEYAMDNIRKNSEQILVLLDTFLYDPLEVDETGNLRPQEIIQRIQDKLTGNDFNTVRPLSVEAQIGRLLKAAVNPANLCQMYQGWAPWY